MTARLLSPATITRLARVNIDALVDTCTDLVQHVTKTAAGQVTTWTLGDSRACRAHQLTATERVEVGQVMSGADWRVTLPAGTTLDPKNRLRIVTALGGTTITVDLDIGPAILGRTMTRYLGRSLLQLTVPVAPDTTTALANDWTPADAGSGHARFVDAANALHAEPVTTFEPALLTDAGGVWARYTGTERAATASTPFLQYESVLVVLRTNAAYMLTALNARVYEHLDPTDGGRGRALTLDLGQGGDVAYVSGDFARPIRAAAEAQWEGGETHTLGYVDDGTRLWMYVDGVARSYYQHNGSLWTGVQTSYESPFNRAGMQAGGAGVPINVGWFGYVAGLNIARFDIGRARRWSRALSAPDMAHAHDELRTVYPALPASGA